MPNKNNDRPSDSFPASSFNRFNYGAPTMRREPPANFKPSALNRELIGDQDTLPENIQKAIKDSPSPKRGAGSGVGSKSIRDRINEDGAKRKAEKAPTKRFCGGKSKPFKRLTKAQKASGQAPQGAQAGQSGQKPQGAKSTFGKKDKDLNPKLKF